jgi:hypothetical protein
MMDLFRLPGGVRRDPAIDQWLQKQTPELGAIARAWFTRIRACGDEVLELMHDKMPTACFGDVAFAYVNVFKAHVAVGFFLGMDLNDPAHLLEGSGKRMRHVKLKPGVAINDAALQALIDAAWADVRSRV